jgi:murein DD-endopeptidase MepM/ murein hydrolase activator NlpD
VYFLSLSRQKSGVPSFEPLLDAVWNWPSYPGYFVCPVPGARLSQGLHGHNAVDLAIAYGTPIQASASGIVIVNKSNGLWNGGYGNFMMISHPNGVETLYAHMSRTAVSVGQEVAQGETIGWIGMTGMTTGPHVHFEIRGAFNPFVDPAMCR